MINLASPRRHIGDIVNTLSIVNILAYGAVIIAHAKGFDVNVSPAFAEDGFCVSNKGEHVLVQSHAICFYEDTILAILMVFLASYVGKNIIPDSAATLIKKNALGCLIHGGVHMSIAYRDYNKGNNSGGLSFPMKMSLYSIFWMSMMNFIHKDISLLNKVVRSLFYVLIHTLLVPRVYGFAFVHSILMLEIGFQELLEKEKDEFYNLKTVLLYIPNSVLAWMEVFGCENYLRPYGGHAIYDVAVPLTNIAYFWLLFSHQKYYKKTD